MARQIIPTVTAATLLSDVNNAIAVIQEELNNSVPRNANATAAVVTPAGSALIGSMDANGQDIINVNSLAVKNIIQVSPTGVVVDWTQLAADATAYKLDLVAAQLLADLVVAKEALLSPHYVAIDSIQTNLVAIQGAAQAALDAAAEVVNAASQVTLATTQATNAASSAVLSGNQAAASAASATASATSKAGADQAFLDTQAALAALGNPLVQADIGTTVAPLVGTKVPNLNLPATALTQDIPLSQKGVAGGVATLDLVTSKVVDNQLPAMTTQEAIFTTPVPISTFALVPVAIPAVVGNPTITVPGKYLITVAGRFAHTQVIRNRTSAMGINIIMPIGIDWLGSVAKSQAVGIKYTPIHYSFFYTHAAGALPFVPSVSFVFINNIPALQLWDADVFLRVIMTRLSGV